MLAGWLGDWIMQVAMIQL